MIGHKCRAVIRLGNAPWGNRPVMAAVGTDLASTTVIYRDCGQQE
jgi:hypothetical protein